MGWPFGKKEKKDNRREHMPVGGYRGGQRPGMWNDGRP